MPFKVLYTVVYIYIKQGVILIGVFLMGMVGILLIKKEKLKTIF